MRKDFYERKRRGGLSWAVFLFLIVLLLFPGLATLRLMQTFEPQFVLGYLFLISVIACFYYRHDKKRAQEGGWRTPESTLHLVELLGGWPGAFLAQRALGHKTAKTSYQVGFWSIVALHEYAACDYIQDWRYLKNALALIFS